MQTCPQCQTLNPPDASWCANCGAPLTAVTASQPVSSPNVLGAAQQPGSLPSAPQGAQPDDPAQPAAQSGMQAPAGPYQAQPPTFPPVNPYASAPPSAPIYPAPYPPGAPPAYPTPYAAPPAYPPAPGAPYPGYTAPPTAPIPGAYPSGYPAGYQGAPSMPYQPQSPSMPLSSATGVQQAVTGSYPSVSGMGAPASQSQTLVDVFGADVEPVAAQPSTRLQQSLMRNISPRYAVNRWFMAAFGAVVAAGIGLVLTFVLQSFIASAITSAVNAASGSSPDSSFISGLVKTVITPDVLKLFALEHRVPFDVTIGGSAAGTSVSGDITFTLPLTGLIIIPALALIIGGYVSAASDFQRTSKFSTARGALIGPFYGVIVAVLAYLASSSAQTDILGVGLNASISPVAWQAFLYGLLWGVVFGGLGGWMQFAGKDVLSQAIPALRARFGQSLGGARIVGAISGALVAIVSGIAATSALIIALLCFVLVYLALFPDTSSLNPQLGAATSASTASSGMSGGVIGLVVFFTLILTPTIAVYLFTLASGASISSTVAGAASAASASGTTSSTYGLFSGTHILPVTTPLWVFSIVLIPVICYFAGGRVAARAAGAATNGDGIIAGAFMAVPASILAALIAYLTSAGVDVSILGQSSGETFTPSVGAVFLTTLVAGGIFGGIGGLTATAQADLGAAFRLLVFPFLPISGWVSARVDAFIGAPQGLPRSPARSRLNDAALAVVGLSIIAIILDACNLFLAPVAPFKTLVMADAIVAALLIFIPLVLLTVALATAFGAVTISSVAPLGIGALPPLAAGSFGAYQGPVVLQPSQPSGYMTTPPYPYAPPAAAPGSWPSAGWTPPMPPASPSSPIPSSPIPYSGPPAAVASSPAVYTPNPAALSNANAGTDTGTGSALSGVQPPQPPAADPSADGAQPDPSAPDAE